MDELNRAGPAQGALAGAWSERRAHRFGIAVVAAITFALGSAATPGQTPVLQRGYNPPVPGALYAFDAENLANELWNSTTNQSRDSYGSFAKFVPPLVANGKVYVAASSNQLVVYELLQ